MKKAKAIATIVAFFAFMTAASLVIVGQCRYQRAQDDIRFAMLYAPDFGTDGDIQDILTANGFDNIGPFDSPGIIDYARAAISVSF